MKLSVIDEYELEQSIRMDGSDIDIDGNKYSVASE